MRIAIAKQVQIPSTSGGKLAVDGPHIMADGGIQEILNEMGAIVRVSNAEMTSREKTEYDQRDAIFCLLQVGTSFMKLRGNRVAALLDKNNKCLKTYIIR